MCWQLMKSLITLTSSPLVQSMAERRTEKGHTRDLSEGDAGYMEGEIQALLRARRWVCWWTLQDVSLFGSRLKREAIINDFQILP